MGFIEQNSELNINSQDPYTFLGLSKRAKQKEIREKKRLLAKSYHPDKFKNEYAESIMALINTAFDAIESENPKAFKNSFEINIPDEIETENLTPREKKEKGEYEMMKDEIYILSDDPGEWADLIVEIIESDILTEAHKKELHAEILATIQSEEELKGATIMRMVKEELDRFEIMPHG